MRIAIHEPFPILEGLLKHLLSQSKTAAPTFVEAAKYGEDYDLFLSDRSWLPGDEEVRARLYLVPEEALSPCREVSGTVLIGGMNGADAVTLSSIGEERALLCLQQEILICGKWVSPFEKPIVFNRRYNLYKNLAAGFACTLAEILRGEEGSL
ncbi:MAG: hypothetical protein IKJ74_03180 [Clostridia bacterium]|nr:hypothetical protein [Clostridia bacterium]